MPAAAPIAYAVLASSLLAIASLRKQLADLPREPFHDRGFGRASFPHEKLHHRGSFVEHRARSTASSRPYHEVASGFRGAEKVVRLRNPVSFSYADLNNDYYFKRADGVVSDVEKGTDDHGKKDAVSFFSPVEFTRGWTETHYILGWRPQMQYHRCEDGTTHQLVHHINLCKGHPLEDDGKDTEIVVSYDRGADAFRLPEGYGIPVRPGEPLYLDTHLLPPSCWTFPDAPLPGSDASVQEDDATDARSHDGHGRVQDSSGIDLVLTTARPKHLARIYGFTDDNMELPPGGGAFEAIHSRDRVAKIAADGGREIIAVHLHTHDIFDRKYFEVRGPDGAVRFQSKPEPAGYGPTQSFRTPAELGWPRLMLEPGLEFRQHCDLSKKLKTPVYDGLTSDEEMCAMLYVVGFSPETKSLPTTSALSFTNGTLVQLTEASTPAKPAGALAQLAEDALESVAAGFRRLLR